MKRQMIAFLMAVVMLAMGSCITNVSVYAQNTDEDIDISNLFTEESLIGYAELSTRGIYLAEGMSAINDAGGGKIGWGGATNAAIRCQVSVTAIVEKKVDGYWERVTSATTTNTNAYTASVSKTRSVESGYWYRVRSAHYASTDTSSSCTSSLWM